MPSIEPPADFGTSQLRLHTVPAGDIYGRIYLARYANPLGYGKTKSRFSDPRRRVEANRFGVLYLGKTIKVCFLEALLRDRRDGRIGDLPIAESELQERHYASVRTKEELRLVDLRDDGPVIMGVPTDVAKASQQTLARKWAVAFHEHPEMPDGIIYPSRLNGHTNLAVFNRAIPKLEPTKVYRLIGAPGLARVLDDLKVAIVEPD